METVGSNEARTQLSRLLDDVARGRSIMITRHGRSVARLVPADDPVSGTAGVIEALRAARSGTTLGAPIREPIDDGRH